MSASDGRIQLAVPELYAELSGLATETPAGTGGEYPFLLSAGERRSYTANTIYRDPGWRKKDRDGALRLCAADAERLGLADGDRGAIAFVYRSLWPIVVRYCTSLVGDPNEAEDLAQTSLLKLFEQAHDYDPNKSAEAWALM